MQRVRGRRVAFFVVFGVLVPLGACGTSALGVDICNQIESARCTKAASIQGNCGVDFTAPFAGASAGQTAATCTQFYSVACLHGLATTTTPTTTQVGLCLQTIYEGGCPNVIDPVEAGGGACQWLIPPEAGPDADGAAKDGVATDTVVTFDAIVDSGVDVFDAFDGQMGLP